MIVYEDLICTLPHTERIHSQRLESGTKNGSQTLRHHFTHEQLEKHLTTNHTENQTRTKILLSA